MPSSTLHQQHFMQMVHAFQMGKLHSDDLPAGVRSKVAKTAKSITKKASKEFAAKVDEQDANIDFSVLSFKEYIVVESALIEAFSELSEDEVELLAEKCSMEDEEPATNPGGKVRPPVTGLPTRRSTPGTGGNRQSDEEYASRMAAERHARKMQAARAAKTGA